jgi:hypothetical protein
LGAAVEDGEPMMMSSTRGVLGVDEEECDEQVETTKCWFVPPWAGCAEQICATPDEKQI